MQLSYNSLSSSHNKTSLSLSLSHLCNDVTNRVTTFLSGNSDHCNVTFIVQAPPLVSLSSAILSRYITPSCHTTLHCTKLNYTTLHYTVLNYTTLHYTTLHCTTLHYTALNCTTLQYTVLHYSSLHCTLC